MSDLEIICETAKKIISLSCNRILSRYKFFFELFVNIQIKEKIGAADAFISCGDTLYYDPVKVIMMYKTDSAAVTHSIMHSFMHCYFLHPFFKDKVEPQIWDLAGDIVVESIIDKMNEDIVYDAKERELSTNLEYLRNAVVPFYLPKIYSVLQSFEPGDIESLSALFRYDLHRWYDNGTSGMAEKDRPDPLGFDEKNDPVDMDDIAETEEEEKQNDKIKDENGFNHQTNENNMDDLLNMLLFGLNISNNQNQSQKNSSNEDQSEELSDTYESGEEVSGTEENGEEVSGTEENGEEVSGTEENGEEVSDTYESGEEVSGTEENGEEVSSTEENGEEVSDTYESGEEVSGTEENGEEVSDTYESGEEVSGTEENGEEVSDTYESGEEVSGTEENGEEVSGTDENVEEVSGTEENEEGSAELRHSLFSDEIINKWNVLSNNINRNSHYDEGQFLNIELLNEITLHLNSVTRPNDDFRNFLKQFAKNKEIMKVNEDEFDYIYYVRGLTLYNNIPLIEPLEYRDEKTISELVIAIDTSGSVYGDLVRKFIKKTYEIISDRQIFGKDFVVHILQCDYMIQDHQIIRSQEEMQSYIKSLTIRGFGRTDFIPVFDLIDEMKKKRELTDLRGLLYFSDGIVSRGFEGFPQKKPDYKTAFIYIDGFNNNYDVPPWVIIKTIDQYELGDEQI